MISKKIFINFQEFKSKLLKTPKEIVFLETMNTIEMGYHFTPTAFTNGDLKNSKGQNSGSCKLFAFAVDQGFSKEETLACFGQYYLVMGHFDAIIIWALKGFEGKLSEVEGKHKCSGVVLFLLYILMEY